MQVYWTDIAIDSLNAVHAFVEGKWGQTIADNFLELVDQSITLLQSQPEIGHKTMGTEFRSLVIHKNVSLFYDFQIDLLKILLVWDNRQDPATLTDIMIQYKGEV